MFFYVLPSGSKATKIFDRMFYENRTIERAYHIWSIVLYAGLVLATLKA